MLSTFRARAMKGLLSRTLFAMIGAAATLLVLLAVAPAGASAAPAPTCDLNAGAAPGTQAVWSGAFEGSKASGRADVVFAQRGENVDNNTQQGENDDNNIQQGENNDNNSGSPRQILAFAAKLTVLNPNPPPASYLAEAKGSAVVVKATALNFCKVRFSARGNDPKLGRFLVRGDGNPDATPPTGGISCPAGKCESLKVSYTVEYARGGSDSGQMSLVNTSNPPPGT